MIERDLIEQIRSLSSADAPALVQGIGDDCAVIEKSGNRVWLLTMDTLVESIHFDCNFHPPELLGRKAVAVNVSDIAAMGGRPTFALLSLGLPEGFNEEWTRWLSLGISKACEQYGCLLIGGDTVCNPSGVSLTLTVIGEMERGRVLYRKNGQVGDTVWVSGQPGRSAAGLALLQSGIRLEKNTDSSLRPLLKAHLDPMPRTALAIDLAASGLVHAMQDISDGLATDLSHLCHQSGLGACIIADYLPPCDGLKKAGVLLSRDPLDWMIRGGEDYELLFTAPPDATETLQQIGRDSGQPLSAVGSLIEGKFVVLVEKGCGITVSDEGTDISFQGYEHFKVG